MRKGKEPVLPMQSNESPQSVDRSQESIDRIADSTIRTENEAWNDDQLSAMYPEIVSRDNSPLSMFSTDDVASRTATPDLGNENDEFGGVALSMTSDAESLPIFTPEVQSPTHSQFVFPDPLPSNTREHSRSKLPEASPRAQTPTEWRTDSDAVGTELCGSPRRRRTRRSPRSWEGLGPSSNDDPPGFLPFFNQHVDNPKSSSGHGHPQAAEGPPSINDCFCEVQNNLANFPEQLVYIQNGLANLPEQLPYIQNNLANLPEQLADIHGIFNSNDGASQRAQDDHLAHEELHSQTAEHTQQLTDLQDRLSNLSVNVEDLRLTAAKDITSLNDATQTLREKNNSLITAWEKMRTELLDLKISHQKLKEQHRESRDSKGRSRRNSLYWAKDPPPTPPSGTPTDPEKVPNQIVIPPKDDFSLGTLFSRWLPDAAPTEAWKRQPTVVTRMPIPEPIAGPAFRGEPPAYDTERSDHRRAAHLKDYPMGCRWPGCPICGEGKLRRRD